VKYNLYEYWRVEVEGSFPFETDIEFSFDFFVKINCPFREIMTLAREIVKKKSGLTGWKIKKIKLHNYQKP